MPSNLPILIPASLALITALAYVLKRRHAGPPPRVMEELERRFPQVQREAGEAPGTTPGFRAGQIRFGYGVRERGEGGFDHQATGHAESAGARAYGQECMMWVMLLLSKQLERAGLDIQRIDLSVREPETGTRCIQFSLTADQHAAWRRVLNPA